jgi:hypothetical protein
MLGHELERARLAALSSQPAADRIVDNWAVAIDATTIAEMKRRSRGRRQRLEGIGSVRLWQDSQLENGQSEAHAWGNVSIRS